MDFFGHAVVASWLRPKVGYVFGSMLPDFASMMGERLPAIRDVEVHAGTQDHRVVDDVFHGLPSFRALCRTLGALLVDLGFDRGRARAVAHIGVEMLLDGLLANDQRACGLYWAVLDQATRHGLGQHVDWSDDQNVRFERLRVALKGRRDALEGDSDPVAVFRLERALHGRPRLALSQEHCEKATLWLGRAKLAVSSGAAALVEELEVGLIARAPDLKIRQLGPSHQPDQTLGQRKPTG